MRRLFPALLSFAFALLATIVGTELLAKQAMVNAPPPNLYYSSFLGGDFADKGYSLAVDAAGNAYVVGKTSSITFPSASLHNLAYHGVDAFLAKFTPQGELSYLLWINAASLFQPDAGNGVAVDAAGNAYVTGDTQSADFCAFFGANVPGYDVTYNGGSGSSDAFVFKVNASGQIVYCTFLGGGNSDLGRAITVDDAGSAYLTGGTFSEDFPTTTGAYDTSHNFDVRDVFVTKLSPDGQSLLFSTFIGGAGQDSGQDIIVDHAGGVHIAGWTTSAGFPTTLNAFDASFNTSNNFDGFIASLSADGSTLNYSSFFGGEGEDRAFGLHRDISGTIYFAGHSNSTDLPVSSSAIDSDLNGGNDLFVAAINGNTLVYGSYLGGSDEDFGNGLTADAAGNLYIVGNTWSSDFMTTTNADDSQLDGLNDGFLVKLDPNANQLLYSSYLGGSEQDNARDLALGSNDEIFSAGTTSSPDFPVTAGVYDESHNGDSDIFVMRLQQKEFEFSLYLPAILSP